MLAAALLLFVAVPQATVVSGVSGSEIVLAALSPDGRDALARELERGAPGRFRVVAGPEPRSLEAAFGSDSPIAAAIGYALPDLLALSQRAPLAAVVLRDPGTTPAPSPAASGAASDDADPASADPRRRHPLDDAGD